MVALHNVGAEAPGRAAPERPEKDDARELGGGAGISMNKKGNRMKSLTSAASPQARLVWESELIDEAPEEASPAQDDSVYAAAWGYWSAQEALEEAKARLLALDNRPLPLDAGRRRRRRGGAADGAASARGGGLLGTFPKRRDTVTAEALARLLKGEKLTGMDAVFDCNTTRFADHVHRLCHRYGWRIESQDVQVRTKDGRATQVSEYWLPPGVIEAATAAGGAEFCADVREARAKRRDGASAV